MSYENEEAVYCLSYFHAKKEYRQELINSLTELIPHTRAEKGCLQYELLIDFENLNFIIMLEKFINQKALNEHEKQPYINHFVEKEMLLYCEKVTWNVAKKLA